MFVDTHAHLNFKDFESDYQAVIENASEFGVGKIIIPSADLESSKKAVFLAQQFKNIYAAIGLHPIHLEKEKFDESVFYKLAKNPKVVAIGETGLDYYHAKNTVELQKEVFLKHVNLAQKTNKPLIIHSRDADDDMLAFLIAENVRVPGVMHCFSGDWQMAKIILDLDFYLSFTGIITFSKNYSNLEVIKQMPLEKILIETDSPFLTPDPYRGKRNEPAYVVEVAKKIAEIKKISLEEVETKTTKNAKSLFKLD